MVSQTITLSELVESAPLTRAVLAYHGIEPDGQTVPEAARRTGMAAGELSAALDLVIAGGRGPWELSPDELIDDILATHHAYLRQALPEISNLLADAAGRSPESAAVAELSAVFADLRGELEMHMMKEEQILFPMIRQLAAGQAITVGCGHVGGPITQMEYEHAAAMDALSRIGQLLDAGALEDRSGPLQRQLRRLGGDLPLHIYKENQVLFPRSAALEHSQVA